MKFEIGDRVELELGPKGEQEFYIQLRWEYTNYITPSMTTPSKKLVDCGYTGKFVRGKVVDITEDLRFGGHCIDIHVLNSKNGTVYSIVYALDDHPLFEPNQWTYPGFVRLINKVPEIKPCTCGSLKTYGPGCSHSHWCDYLTK